MHPVVSYCRKWRYLALLAALSALLILNPLARPLVALQSFFDVLLLVVVLLLAVSLAGDKYWRLAACLLLIATAVMFLADLAFAVSARFPTETAAYGLASLFFVAAAGRTIASIFTSQQLSLDSIFGAICGYVLLGVAWGLVYAMLYNANLESFQLSEATRAQLEQGDDRRHIFIYYSFVTLTTVGYGDVSPLSIQARTLAWLEAVIGQLYLAVLIAGLVGAWVTRDSKPTPMHRG